MIISAIMMGLIIIIGLIVLINFVHNSDHGDMADIGLFFGILLSILCVIEICIVSKIIEEPKPTSMDVYQGKTTLEYTIRDGEVIDSVVVFKENND